MTTSTQPLIVFVDDEQDFGIAVADYFNNWATVKLAASVAEGTRLLNGHCPDILLVDLRLPDGDGLALLRLAMERCPETERILITAHTEHEAIQTAINELRCAYYVAKPIDLLQLGLILQRLRHTTLLRRSQQDLRAQVQHHYQYLEERITERTQTPQQAYEELQRLFALREQMMRFLIHDIKASLPTCGCSGMSLPTSCS
ncbi:MAG: response regulator [Candidatus Kapabacteria bacterium]|nr:response regulator [Candidatus Kapabacteria bacterium]MCS7169077.1 response regulator [Candidatus Kapabacteria bacterium]MDW7997524.1 response regulator [Bacteroidota bacterium]MDW8225795.1 response regulator [Bacteroidota bacterium]